MHISSTDARNISPILENLSPGALLQLGPGVFLLKNTEACGALIPDGVTIAGSGPDTTRLVLSGWPDHWVEAPASAQKFNMLLNSAGGAGGITLANFTLDAAWHELGCPYPEGAINGTALHGSNNRVDRVRYANFYGCGTGATVPECFQCYFSASPLGGSNIRAADCEFVTPRGDYQAGVCLFGLSEAQPLRDALVTGCYTQDRLETGLVNLAYIDGVLIHGNFTRNSAGVYCDTGTVKNLTVRDNSFLDCFSQGVMLNINRDEQFAKHLVISDNVISLGAESATEHIYGICVGKINCERAVIENNRLQCRVPEKRGYMIYFMKVRDSLIRNNFIDTEGSYCEQITFDQSDPALTFVDGNRTPNGAASVVTYP
jgi:hypothetical protein